MKKFKSRLDYDVALMMDETAEQYQQRYIDSLGRNGSRPLAGVKGFWYQHTGVGREMMPPIAKALGMDLYDPGHSVEVAYEDEKGVQVEETVSLRGKDFMAVDTENVSNQTMAVFTKIMNEQGLDVGFTTDGDSDRPLLVYRAKDGTIKHVTGDILGALTVKALLGMDVQVDAVAIPESSNEAIEDILYAIGVKEVVRTKIGSPYVIEAMDNLKEKYKGGVVVGWEANGGFMTATPITINGIELSALPTRDAMLPILSVLLDAQNRGVSVADLVDELPPYYTSAAKKELQMEFGQGIVKSISPILEGKDDHNILEANFVEGKIKYRDGSPDTVGLASAPDDVAALAGIKDYLETRFRENGLLGETDTIDRIRYLDGVKIYLSTGEITHFRPSGNEPAFRNYAQASTEARASEVLKIGMERLIEALANDVTVEEQVTPGMFAAVMPAGDVRFTEAVAVLNSTIAQGLPITFAEEYKTAKEGYDWGAIFNNNAIVSLLGTERIAELKAKLAAKYDISEAEVDELPLGERWVSAGDVEVTLSDGSKYSLPAVLLSLWGIEVFGGSHRDKYGPEIGITAKDLNAGRPLSVQYHRFDEMIIPMEEGRVAYIGFKENVTRGQVEEALRKGTIQNLMNEVPLPKGVPYIVPAFTVHAYGEVSVYEVKAVNSTQDKAGTESFYDRLKYLDDTAMQQAIAEKVRNNPDEPGASKPRRDEILAARIKAFTNSDGTHMVRPGKDILTKAPEEMERIFRELAANGGFNQTNEVDLIYDQRDVHVAPDNSVYKVMGETATFVSGKYEVVGNIEAYEDTVGIPHSLFVTSGNVKLVRDGKEILRLNVGSEAFIPANVGSYEIVSLDGPAEVYTQHIPRDVYEARDGQEGKVIPMPLEFKTQTEVLGQKEPAYVVRGVFDQYGVAEVVEINTETNWKDKVLDPEKHSMPLMLDGRDFTLVVEEGSLGLNIAGVTLADNDKPVYFSKGTRIMVFADSILAMNPVDGTMIEYPKEISDIIDLVKQPDSDGSVIVNVSYPKTDAEKVTYTIFRAIYRVMDEQLEKNARLREEGKPEEPILKTKHTLIYPKETFVSDSIGGPGSRQWLQGIMNDYFGEGNVEIRSEGYEAYEIVDGEKVAKSLSEVYKDIKAHVAKAQGADRTVVVGTVQSAINSTDALKPEVSSFFASVRVSAMPDLNTLVGGWSFINEAVGVALLQGMLQAEDIENTTSIAQDVLKVMKQVSSPNLQMTDMYKLLPFGDAGIPIEFSAPDALAWMKQLVQKLLLDMPVQAFNATDQLEQRRRIMWSV